MTAEKLILFGVVGFFSSIISSIAGAGGGFITTPLAIFLGLTPQQAIATGKISGLSISLGSLHGFRKAKLHSWRFVIPVMALAGVIGLLAPQLITRIDNDSYRRILGAVLLAMIPVLFLRKVGQQKAQTAAWQKIAGYALLIAALCLQAVFSSGMGTLVNIALMVFFGMSSLEANVTKRYSQLILNSVIVLAIVGSGLIVWQVAAVNVVGSFVGGIVGSRIALKKGDAFVMIIFAIIMFFSGLELLFG